MARKKSTEAEATPGKPSKADKGEAAEKKPGRFAQVRQVYTASRAIDPAITWWMIGAALAVIAVVTLVGLLIHHWLYFLIISLPLGLLAATIVMGRRAERAAYRQLEGQPGAAGAALSALRRGWYYEKQPVAADATKPGDFGTAALVFRAVGRPGVVLVTEGPVSKATRLAETERKRVNRLVPNVPVTVMRVGDGEDQVAVRSLAKKVSRLKPALTKQEVEAVNKRLKALGGVRMPVPKGLDPLKARPDRKAMRGR